MVFHPQKVQLFLLKITNFFLFLLNDFSSTLVRSSLSWVGGPGDEAGTLHLVELLGVGLDLVPGAEPWGALGVEPWGAGTE